MTHTELLYLEDFTKLSCEAEVAEVEVWETDRAIVMLDRTVFYPQGGGQPWDVGRITSGPKVFVVDEVRWSEGVVKHFGKFEKEAFVVGDSVTCVVDAERRKLHSRIHSAGHIVDFAVWRLGLAWVPGKGYHFPVGPYVEYAGNLDGVDKEQLKAEIERVCGEIVKESLPTKLIFPPKEDLGKYCRHIPENLPEGKPIRIVSFGDYGVPCGGTHISNTMEAVKVIIRKIKYKDGVVQVGYAVE